MVDRICDGHALVEACMSDGTGGVACWTSDEVTCDFACTPEQVAAVRPAGRSDRTSTIPVSTPITRRMRAVDLGGRRPLLPLDLRVQVRSPAFPGLRSSALTFSDLL